MKEIPVVVTLSDAAKSLVTTPEALAAEIGAGNLRAFRLGDEWRTTVDWVLEFIERGGAGATPVGRPSLIVGAPVGETAPPGVPTFDWQEAEPFSYRWPSNDVETYEYAYEATAAIRGREVTLRIGSGNRQAAGMERARMIVFIGKYPRIYPLVEFVGANDYATSGRLVSVIKKAGAGHLRPDEPLPGEYANLPVDLYTNVVHGPYAPRSMAVVARSDQLDVMAQHALIRAQANNRV